MYVESLLYSFQHTNSFSFVGIRAAFTNKLKRFSFGSSRKKGKEQVQVQEQGQDAMDEVCIQGLIKDLMTFTISLEHFEYNLF